MDIVVGSIVKLSKHNLGNRNQGWIDRMALNKYKVVKIDGRMIQIRLLTARTSSYRWLPLEDLDLVVKEDKFYKELGLE